MKWFLLSTGIITQVLSATCMKLSSGFSNLLMTVLAFVFWGVSFSIFILALKDFDLSYAFALYAGAGVVLVAAVGVLFLGEPVSGLKVASVVLVALGVAGLNI
jgi:small multidrug resistance pump